MTDGNSTLESFEVALSKALEVDVERVTEALNELTGLGYSIPAPPPSGRIWQPSPQAIANARQTVTVMDIPVSIARYVTVKAEQGRPPTSSEWLKWLFADEQKAKQAAAQQEKANGNGRSWFSVAE